MKIKLLALIVTVVTGISVYAVLAPSYIQTPSYTVSTISSNHAIIIGGCNIQVTNDYELAFGGCNGQPVYRLIMTPEEWSVIHGMLRRVRVDYDN